MLKIRRAKKSDARRIYQIMNSSQIFPLNFTGLQKEDIKKIEEFLSMKERQFFLALEEKEAIGYTSFTSMGLYPDLKLLPNSVNKTEYCMSSGLVVEPKFRNKGIAKELKFYAFKEASRKYKRMYSTLSTDNKSSLNLQKSLGLKKVGEYNQKGRKMFLFFKKL